MEFITCTSKANFSRCTYSFLGKLFTELLPELVDRTRREEGRKEDSRAKPRETQWVDEVGIYLDYRNVFLSVPFLRIELRVNEVVVAHRNMFQSKKFINRIKRLL